jgi:hypothetical protein
VFFYLSEFHGSGKPFLGLSIFIFQNSTEAGNHSWGCQFLSFRIPRKRETIPEAVIFLSFRIPRKRETIPGAEFPKQFLDELAEPVLDKLAATFTKTL